MAIFFVMGNERAYGNKVVASTKGRLVSVSRPCQIHFYEFNTPAEHNRQVLPIFYF